MSESSTSQLSRFRGGLRYNTSGEKTVQQVFSEKTRLRGVDQLKHRLSELPAGANVYWVDRLPSGTGPRAKGSESLRYPPAEIMADVKRFAEAHKVKFYNQASQ
jgi:hypothetical protein